MATEQTTPRTEEQKRRVVAAFNNRGSKTVDEIAQRFKVSTNTLYMWRNQLRRIDDDRADTERQRGRHTPLDECVGPPPIQTAEVMATDLERRNGGTNGTAPNGTPGKGPPEHWALELRHITEELARVVEENDRLRGACKACLQGLSSVGALADQVAAMMTALLQLPTARR